jgi:hypothetical protein
LAFRACFLPAHDVLWLGVLSTGHRALLSLLAAAPILTMSSGASAADPKPVAQPAGVDLDRLGKELDLYAAEAHRTKVATAVTGLTIGSAVVPAGIILLGRTDGVSQALVIGMIVGGSAQLLSVPLSLIPTRMDDVRKQLRERLAQNAATRDTVHTIEVEWRDAAVSARTKRFRVGGALLTFGLVSLATGLTLLIASEGIFGMSRKAQYTWGGVAMGTGMSTTTIGTRFLLEWSPEETAWEAYGTMRYDRVAMAERARWPSIAFVPTSGGALASASLIF